jgi:uncharacterized protein with FMN-binding domain
MRRSTAAAVGTLTGAALIMGVRLSVTPPAAPAAAPAAVDVADDASRPAPASGKSSGRTAGKAPAAKKFKDGTYPGRGVQNQFGTVRVTVKVSGGEITDVAATYPVTGNSATINPAAVPQLRREVLKAQSAKIAAVSGATYTSRSYTESLQSALDAARA